MYAIRRNSLPAVILVTVIFALASSAFAQEDCFTRVNRSVAATLENCAALGPNQICSGAGSVEGISGLGPIQSVQQITTAPDANEVGMAVLSLSLPPQEPPAEDTAPPSMTLNIFGSMTLTSSDPSWRAFSIEQSGAVCRGNARPSGVLLQLPPGFREPVQINGVNLAFDQTIFATVSDGQLHVNVLEGDANIQSEPVFAGFQWSADGTVPYDLGSVATLPVNLLPRIVRVALPGQVTLADETPLFAEARDSSRIVIELLPPGSLLNVYGADLTGQWRHVVESGGQVGWIPVASLESDLSSTIPAYEATPHLMARPFGPTWGIASTGFGQVNLRIGPSDEDGILAQLPADTSLAILGRDTSLDWLYVRPDEAAEGWVFVDVIDLPPDFRIGELPLAP